MRRRKEVIRKRMHENGKVLNGKVFWVTTHKS